MPDLLNTLLQFLPLKAKGKAKGKSSKAQSDKTPGGLSQAKAAKSKSEHEASQWSLAHEMQHNLSKPLCMVSSLHFWRVFIRLYSLISVQNASAVLSARHKGS